MATPFPRDHGGPGSFKHGRSDVSRDETGGVVGGHR